MAKEEIPKGLYWIFLVHFFVGAFFGVVYLIFAETLIGTIGWPYNDPVMTRLLGGALIALGTSSLLAWREKELDKVKLVVEMEMVWLVIAVVVSIWGAIVTGNWLAWLSFGLFVAFLVGFGNYYFKSY